MVTIDPTGVYIDGAMVTVADILADNGVVHVIDAVLIPQPPAGNSVYDVIVASPDHTTLALAIDTAGLAGTLKRSRTIYSICSNRCSIQCTSNRNFSFSFK